MDLPTVFDRIYLNIFTVLSPPSLSLYIIHALINALDVSTNFLVPTLQLLPLLCSISHHLTT
jgi:hypothetical protein